MKIIKANNFIDAEIGAIKEIVPNSLHEKYIVITPDRYSLNLEKNIFEILNVDSLFNVSVLSVFTLCLSTDIVDAPSLDIHFLYSARRMPAF